MGQFHDDNRELLHERLEGALNVLTPGEKKVLQLRFGLDNGCRRTPEEVGRVFGVGPERIRQIETQALRKLRHPGEQS